MTRGTLAVDRLMTALGGLLLAALGVLGILWWAGRLGSAPAPIDLSGIRWLPKQQWWPWALGAAGVLLALLGLRWLLSHLPRRGVTHLSLPGSGPEGRLVVSTGPVVDAAATTLANAPGVRSAHGRIDHDRGQLVVHLDATIERGAQLETVASVADAVTAEMRSALERDDLTARVQLRTAGRNRPAPRVY
ncbi:hypothetical protein [Terrabacter terrigena]|uniref:Alkaline shock response membrane anchor protein AmaP n=1 Tax=Terrabacter terrigena TaxID=574718 RepID=A0ABW3MZD7_9MICO